MKPKTISYVHFIMISAITQRSEKPNKYRNKAEQRYLENKENKEVKENSMLYKIIEDKHSLYKIILWCILHKNDN